MFFGLTSPSLQPGTSYLYPLCTLSPLRLMSKAPDVEGTASVHIARVHYNIHSKGGMDGTVDVPSMGCKHAHKLLKNGHTFQCHKGAYENSLHAARREWHDRPRALKPPTSLPPVPSVGGGSGAMAGGGTQRPFGTGEDRRGSCLPPSGQT